MIESETKEVWYCVEFFYCDDWYSLGNRFDLESSAREEFEKLQAEHPDRKYRIIKRTTTYTDEVVK